MMKTFLVIVAVTLASVALALAQNTNQNTNSSTTRTRTVAPKPSPTPKTSPKSTTESQTATKPPVQRPKSSEPGGPASSSTVLAAFNKLLDGIRHADVKAVTNAYQNSPRLLLFNYNGTVTKGWEQLKQNREASYPGMKDVKLDTKDLRVTMLGRDAALITCQWTQSMTFRGTPETDSGRMTIVFRRIGKDWKAIHLHTSNDSPDASRIPPSEQTPPATPKITP